MAEYARKVGPADQTFTVLSGQQNSDAKNLQDAEVVGVVTPAALTGVALTFLTAPTLGGAYVGVYKEDGTLYSVTVAAARFTMLDPRYFKGLRYLKVRSGAAEGADRTIILRTRVAR